MGRRAAGGDFVCFQMHTLWISSVEIKTQMMEPAELCRNNAKRHNGHKVRQWTTNNQGLSNVFKSSKLNFEGQQRDAWDAFENCLTKVLHWAKKVCLLIYGLWVFWHFCLEFILQKKCLESPKWTKFLWKEFWSK